MKPSPLIKRYIHVRLNSFLASIVERENPKLQGRPIVISEMHNNEERVLSCNIPAKKLGIQKGDTILQAKKRCTWVAVFPSDIELAKTYAKEFIALLCRFSTKVYPHNRLDEAYIELDVSGIAASSPEEFAATIQRSIKVQLGLNASIGIARTRSVAWSAALHKQPEGITSVPIGSERAFLYPLPLTQLYSLGQRSREYLLSHGIRTIGQLAACSSNWLVEQFGSAGYELLQLGHGQDIKEVKTPTLQKSISRSLRFEAPTSNPALIETTVAHLSEKALRTLQKQGRRAETVVLQVTDIYGRSHQSHAKLSSSRNSFQKGLYSVFRHLTAQVSAIRSIAVQLHTLLETPQEQPNRVWQSQPVQSAILGLEWRSGQRARKAARSGSLVQLPLLGMSA
ncbi:MAG: hypothetical protein H6760_02950 [Candidatus Nomurabacteria bacterium]|nr:MAG: hypothetical protein H6760_02950 [Candidatus Nomurabacteria bacterium]